MIFLKDCKSYQCLLRLSFNCDILNESALFAKGYAKNGHSELNMIGLIRID